MGFSSCSSFFSSLIILIININIPITIAISAILNTGNGKPNRLNKEEREILHKASFPGINFIYNNKSTILNLLPKLKGYGAQLILIKKVQKHLK